MELVSIITPAYNCGRFIAETIRSVLNQTHQDWEMLIVDDCSSDNTREIVEEFCKADPRIKYHCLQKNSGAAGARNTALRMASGKWIAFLDSDDLWRPQKLERQIKFMIEKGCHFSYHPYSEMDEEGHDNGVTVGGIRKVNTIQMFTCCWPGCLSVMYDREKIGLIQIENIPINNDTALWLKAIRKAPCHFLDENLARYRRRKGGLTPSGLYKRIWAHYPLFRVAEHLNPISASLLTITNVFGNAYKKLFFVKKNGISN